MKKSNTKQMNITAPDHLFSPPPPDSWVWVIDGEGDRWNCNKLLITTSFVFFFFLSFGLNSLPLSYCIVYFSFTGFSYKSNVITAEIESESIPLI